MALWESGGASATVSGGLPQPVRQTIFGLFHMVYRRVKRYGCFSQLTADADTTTLMGAQVAPAYRSRAAAREIAHAIARPIRAAGREQVLESAFFALVSHGRCGTVSLSHCPPVHRCDHPEYLHHRIERRRARK